MLPVNTKLNADKHLLIIHEEYFCIGKYMPSIYMGTHLCISTTSNSVKSAVNCFGHMIFAIGADIYSPHSLQKYVKGKHIMIYGINDCHKSEMTMCPVAICEISLLILK